MAKLMLGVLVTGSAWVLLACGSDTKKDTRCSASGEVLVGQADVCRHAVAGESAYDPVLTVGADDTLFLTPGPGRTVYRSRDGARSFAAIDMGGDGDPAGEWLHPWIHRDATTGRIFANRHHLGVGEVGCENNSGTSLWYSDDNGDHWTHSAVGCGSFDWAKVITGAAATDAQRKALAESGYAQMVYLCATGPTLIVGPDHMCFRSSDGGKTFEATAGLAADATDNDGSLLPIAFPQAGAVGKTGTLYKTHAAKDGVAVKISRDGGDSWERRSVSGSTLAGAYTNFLSSNIALDAAGALYVTWVDDTDHQVYLSVSRDDAESWSPKLRISPDEVLFAGYPNLTVFADGKVALAYYGSPTREGKGDGYSFNDGRPYHAYLTVLSDVHDVAGLVTARINASDAPVANGWSYNTSEYLGAPVQRADGSIWAAYVNNGHALLGQLTLPK